MGNSKNKKVSKKRKTLDKSMRKNSSDQKENLQKNKKTRASIKPNPNDGIAMSKQLLLKKNIARRKRQPSSKPERICPNGKPVPSLSELEKMFEDSDDDDHTPKPTCTPSTPQKQSPANISEKIQFSPSTISKIAERVLGSIQKQNLPDPSEVLEATSLLREKSPPSSIIPPKKRKKTEIPYIVGCKDRPQVIRKPSTQFCKGDDDYGVSSGEDPNDEIPTKRAKKSRIPKYSKSIFNAHSDEIAERLMKKDAGGLSDASSDSNKTIEYDRTVFQYPRPHSFSPLPSTSKDSETFKKNDELFRESLREMNYFTKAPTLQTEIEKQITPESILKEEEEITKETTLKINDLQPTNKPPLKNEDDLKIIEIPYDTIVIDDICEKSVEIQNTSNNEVTNIIEIIEPSKEVFMTPKKDIIVDKIPDDEDCMIVASSETINNHNNLNEPIVIDDEYSSINMEYDSFTNDTEIIDVDDVIAENKSILDKLKTIDQINTVVDVPTTYRNVTSLETVTPTTTQATQDIEIPKSLQPAIIPTTIQNNNPPSHNYLNRTNKNQRNRNSATNSRRNKRPAARSASDPQRSITFQSILNDFFTDTQRSRTPISVSEGMVRFFTTLRLPSLINNNFRNPSQPVNTATPNSTPMPNSTPTPNSTAMPYSSNTIANADARQQDALRNSSSNSLAEQTSTMTLPPSPAPARNIGDCPICLDPLSSSNGIASTICGHVFCLNCIQASVRTNGKKCPTCRKALKGAGGGYHQLYL